MRRSLKFLFVFILFLCIQESKAKTKRPFHKNRISFKDFVAQQSTSPVNGHSYSGQNGRSMTMKDGCNCSWTKERCGCDCSGELSEQDLKDVSSQFKPCKAFHFKLSGTRFYALPSNFFSGVETVKEFHLEIRDAIVEHLLEPGGSPFRGVKFQDKAFIKLSNVRAIRSWNWSPLKELKSMSGNGVDVEIDGCSLTMLSSDFSDIATGAVDNVQIQDSRLEMIGGGSFASFSNLTHLQLARNRIRSLRRSILPKKAERLEVIDLRKNNLESIERDMFISMPNLRKVNLQDNPIRQLSEEAFLPIIHNTHIEGLSTLPLVCDCKLKWLKNVNKTNKSPNNFDHFICKRPLHLRGKPLRDLAPEHLKCF